MRQQASFKLAAVTEKERVQWNIPHVQRAKCIVLLKEVETLARKNATLIQYQVKALLIRKQLEKCAYKSTQSLVSSLWTIIFIDCATHMISLHCLCFD